MYAAGIWSASNERMHGTAVDSEEGIEGEWLPLRRGEWALGFERAVQRCGEILNRHLPARDRNPNEIQDELIIKP